MRRVVDVFVPGIPVTKGSTTPDRYGRHRDASNRQKADGTSGALNIWADAVRRAVTVELERMDGRRAIQVQQNEGAMIRCRFWVLRPPIADEYGGIWAPQVGDGDKLERATWDAVTKAGLWQDDAQAVEWAGSRRWASDVRAPGVHIGVWALSAEDIASDMKPEVDSGDAYRRAMYGAGATG